MKRLVSSTRIGEKFLFHGMSQPKVPLSSILNCLMVNSPSTKAMTKLPFEGFYLPVSYSEITVQNACILHAVARYAHVEGGLTMANQNIVEVYLSLHIVLCRRREACFYALLCQRNRHLGSEFRRVKCQFYLVIAILIHLVFLIYGAHF